MLLHVLPDKLGGDEYSSEQSPTAGRNVYMVSTHRTRSSESLQNRMGRSFSPPTEEDLGMISAEAVKWAEVRAPMPARKKDVRAKQRSSEADNATAGRSSVPAEEEEEWVREVRKLRDRYYQKERARQQQQQLTPGVPRPLPPSELTRILAPGSTSSSSASAHSRSRKTQLMQLKIFCPFLFKESQRIAPVIVKLSDQSNLMDVIRATLRDLRVRFPHVNPNPDAYRLRVAEDETGRPDEDLPVLDKKTGLCKTGFDSLVLCEVPLSSLSQATTRKTLEDVTFRVAYGADKKRHKQLMLTPDILFKDTLPVVCEKLKRDPSKHALLPCLDGSEKDYLGDKTLGCLSRNYGVTELHLKSKSLDEDDCESDTEIDSIIPRANMFWDWDEASASRYTEYLVIKINKFGSRQPRILGIDREKIYNMMRGTKVQKTKNPERSISDVTVVRTFDDKPCYFEIEYRNSKSGKDQIECQSPMESLEVATKVRFLQGLHKAATAQSTIAAAQQEKKISTILPIAGMDKLLAKITPQSLHSPRTGA